MYTKVLSVLLTLLFTVVKHLQSYSGNYFNRLHRLVVRTIVNHYRYLAHMTFAILLLHSYSTYTNTQCGTDRLNGLMLLGNVA